MVDLSQLGIIGNCRSAALISRAGEVVWACLPDFDSPSVFAKLVDEEKGGVLAVVPEEPARIEQEYLENTNVLRTHFRTPSGAFELFDFMPIYAVDAQTYNRAPELYRLLRPLEGKPLVRIRYRPRLNYGAVETRTDAHGEYLKSVTARGEYHSVYCYTNIPFTAVLEERPFPLAGPSYFLVSFHQKLGRVDVGGAFTELERTKTYWLNWVSRTSIYALYQKEIVRSALTLKLLTYGKTGAVIAAATTSIPEYPGDSRNWDYRYCWIRDSAMILQTLRELRHGNTARQFLRFLLDTIIRKADTLQILYSIRGEKDLPERRLPHLAGYKKSKPVRVGNDAYRQKQNDVYGVLMDLIHTSFVHFPTSLPESEELWTTVRYIMRTVEDNWRKPDRGVWEMRTRPRHFVFSKVLSWVAVDRGLALANLLERDEFVPSWSALREEIRNDVETHGWNEAKGAYTQSYGSGDLDASLLLLERVGFCTADAPRWVSTVRAVEAELSRDGLLYRYRNKDDYGVPRSAFLICSFWMADALYRIGERERAGAVFERLLSCANRLGLFSEDLDFETHELYGNFPQGYSHLALINTAVLLNEGRQRSGFIYRTP
ncbi:MAG: glycoside hydrolase family 15 protein [Spirochaetales bacterium]|nr:glycoside hydrolase family 15 protein [Spirochaetales bacterium]